MTEQPFACPLCGGAMCVTPARWHTCQHCQGRVLVPSALGHPERQRPCCICGDLVRLHTEIDDDDVVCPPCFEHNLAGALPYDRPHVARLVQRWPTRRRELQAMNRQRWPLTYP